MVIRVLSGIILASLFITGCTPTREITYSLENVGMVSSADSVTAVTKGLTLSIKPFEDIRESVPENGILFVRSRETKLNDKDYCINSEEHYVKNALALQTAKILSAHFTKRGTFKQVSSDPSVPAEYTLTGRIKRLYGEQELSSSARAGSYFGLIGALATSNATTKGNIYIELTDLVLHRSKDGAEQRIEDVRDNFTGDLSADAYCWCIYDNVNNRLKLSVEKMAAIVEKAAAVLESSK